jgi:hypothetical protein
MKRSRFTESQIVAILKEGFLFLSIYPMDNLKHILHDMDQ